MIPATIETHLRLHHPRFEHRMHGSATTAQDLAAAELVPESEFRATFQPCETGAEPPLALFDVPIFVDEKLLAEKKLLMPAGTHEDAIVLDTHEWMLCEHVQPIANLGVPMT